MRDVIERTVQIVLFLTIWVYGPTGPNYCHSSQSQHLCALFNLGTAVCPYSLACALL